MVRLSSLAPELVYSCSATLKVFMILGLQEAGRVYRYGLVCPDFPVRKEGGGWRWKMFFGICPIRKHASVAGEHRLLSSLDLALGVNQQRHQPVDEQFRPARYCPSSHQKTPVLVMPLAFCGFLWRTLLVWTFTSLGRIPSPLLFFYFVVSCGAAIGCKDPAENSGERISV